MIGVCLVALLCSAPAAPQILDLAAASEILNTPVSVSTQQVSPQRDEDETDVDFRRFHETLGWNFVHGLVSRDNLWALVVGGGTSLAAVTVDDELSDELRGRFNGLGDVGHFIGHPVMIASSVAGLVAVAPLTDNRRFRTFAYTLAQAQILDSAVKYGLKAAVSRTRPNGENDNAFPSGHTSATFAFATVADHYYGKKVSIPGYVIAAIVGVSRIEKGKHYLSDVLFGATLGYITGRTAVRGTERTSKQERVTFHPVVGYGRAGVLALVQF